MDYQSVTRGKGDDDIFASSRDCFKNYTFKLPLKFLGRYFLNNSPREDFYFFDFLPEDVFPYSADNSFYIGKFRNEKSPYLMLDFKVLLRMRLMQLYSQVFVYPGL